MSAKFCIKTNLYVIVSVQHMISMKHHRRYENVQRAAGKQISHFCPVCGVSGMPDMNSWTLHLSSALHMRNYDQYIQILNAQKKALKRPKGLNLRNIQTKKGSKVNAHSLPNRPQTVHSAVEQKSLRGVTDTSQCFDPHRADNKIGERDFSFNQQGRSLPAVEFGPLRSPNYHDGTPHPNPSGLLFSAIPRTSTNHPCSNSRDLRSQINRQRNFSFVGARKDKTLLPFHHLTNGGHEPVETRENSPSRRFNHRIVHDRYPSYEIVGKQPTFYPSYYLNDETSQYNDPRFTPDQRDHSLEGRDGFVPHSHIRDGVSSSNHRTQNRVRVRYQYFRPSSDRRDAPDRRHSLYHPGESSPPSTVVYLDRHMAPSRLDRSGISHRFLNSHRKSGACSLNYHSRHPTSHVSRMSGNNHDGGIYRHKSSKSPRDHQNNHHNETEKSHLVGRLALSSVREGEYDKMKGPVKETKRKNPDKTDASQASNADTTNLKDSVENNSSRISPEVVHLEEVGRPEDKNSMEPTEVLIPGSITAEVAIDPQRSNFHSEAINTHTKKSGDRDRGSGSSKRKREKEVTGLEGQPPQEVMEHGGEENRMASITLDTSDRQFAFMSTVEKTHEVSRLSEEIEELTHHQARLTHYIRQLKYIRRQSKEEKRHLRRRLSALLLEMNQSDSQAETGSSDNFDDSTPQRIEFEEPPLEVSPSNQANMEPMDVQSAQLLLKNEPSRSADERFVVSLLEDDAEDGDALPSKRAKMNPVCEIQFGSADQPADIESSRKRKKRRRGSSENIPPAYQTPSNPRSSNQSQDIPKVKLKRNSPNSEQPSVKAADPVDGGSKVNEKRLRYIRGLLSHPKCGEYTFEELDRLISDYGRDKLLRSQQIKGKQE
ncbi:hypothetical protein Aperf_G00000091205 [Anoplocephala perfoliata]